VSGWGTGWGWGLSVVAVGVQSTGCLVRNDRLVLASRLDSGIAVSTRIEIHPIQYPLDLHPSEILPLRGGVALPVQLIRHLLQTPRGVFSPEFEGPLNGFNLFIVQSQHLPAPLGAVPNRRTASTVSAF